MLVNPEWERKIHDAVTYRGALWRAADIIEKKGWAFRTSLDLRTGGRCAQSAIAEACGFDITIPSPPVSTAEHMAKMGLVNEANTALLRHLGLDPVNSTVPGWNDQVGMTKEQVVTALRAAAIAA